MADSPLHDRLYRALLKLFPREFRGDFGDQMADDFRDQREDAARGGAAAPVVRLWRRTVIDALGRAPREHLDILRRDAGYALRLFRRRPGMTASALLTLAIGIGLTSAVFSVVYGVLWRSLPLPESERLVYVTELGPPPARQKVMGVSQPNFVAWRRQTRALDAMGSIRPTSATLVRDGEAEELLNAAVNREFFQVVPIRPVLGRSFNEEDFAPLRAQLAARDPKHWGSVLKPTVAILGYDLWQRQFGGRTDIVGQKVDFGEAGLVEIIGVFGKDAPFPVFRTAACWFPDIPEPDISHGGYLTVIGRLAPGASVESAHAEFQVLASQTAAAAKPGADRGADITPLRAHLTRNVQTQLWFLFWTAACVLLIAGANVSNLVLTHTSGRQRELHTRMALGASRGHLVRQALTEGLVLAAAGGVAGLLLAGWAVPLLISMAPPNTPRLREITMGWESLAFAGVLSVCLGVTCGLTASLTSGRRFAVATMLRATGASHHGGRLRRGLIVAEVAVALMLAVAAGLLVQTMRQIEALPLGYDPSRVIAIAFSPHGRTAEGTAAKAQLEAALIDGIRSVEGVVSAGVGSRPLGSGAMLTGFAHPGNPAESIMIPVDPVGPEYLEALGARVVSGRFFTDRDGPEAAPVALVNEAAARRYWPDGALGQSILQNKRPVLIVGVLNDIRRTGLEVEPEPTLYLPSAQTAQFWTNNVLVRTSGDPRELLPAIRTVVRHATPGMPLRNIQTLEERLAVVTAPRRFTLWLVGLFSIIALGLAVIGIYGVIAESVAQRVPEIGVRMALGASAGGVMQMVLRQGAWMIGLGIALGTAAAFALNGVMTSFVFRVPTTDPVSFAIACVTLTLAGLVACAIPAHRASRIDPMIALRTE